MRSLFVAVLHFKNRARSLFYSFFSRGMLLAFFILAGCSTELSKDSDLTSASESINEDRLSSLTLQPKENQALSTGQDRKPVVISESTRRIVFLGDSITHQGGMVTHFSLWLRYFYPDREFDIINIGLPSETVTGLSEVGHAGGDFPRPYLHNRLEQALDKVQPDLVIAMFGINCGIYEPYTKRKQQLYQEGMLKLDKALAGRGIPVLYTTPPMYDHQRGETLAVDYNSKVMAEFSRWLMSMKSHNWQVVDLYSPMNNLLNKHREHSPEYFLQHDGIHFTNDAYWLLTQLQSAYFFNNPQQKHIVDATESPEALASLLSSSPKKLLQLSDKKMQLMRDAWLEYSGHTRPGLPEGLAIEELPSVVNQVEQQIKLILR